MRHVGILLLASLLTLSGPAVAGADQALSVNSMASEHRLSADQIETILDDAARKRRQAEPSDEALPAPIHGEIGFSVGTGGHRSAFGTAIVPLPGDGAAIFSLGTDRFEPSRDFYYHER